jgi:hypothetical protein
LLAQKDRKTPTLAFSPFFPARGLPLITANTHDQEPASGHPRDENPCFVITASSFVIPAE